MAVVEKLAEVPVAEIGHGAGASHIVFDGSILPLHGYCGEADTETIDVLIIASGGTRFAYATAGSIDTYDVDLATATSETGRTLLLLDDQAIELLDLQAFASDAPTDSRLSCRLPSADRWSREVLRPLVESAGYRVAEAGEGPFDLEIIFEGEDGATLRLEGTHTQMRAKTPGIDRNDRSALTAALMAASMRSAG